MQKKPQNMHFPIKWVFLTIPLLMVALLSLDLIDASNVKQAQRLILKNGASSECIECHQEEGKKWLNSHHKKAMEVADENTILGDFNNAVFKNPKDGMITKFFKKKNRYYVNTQGPDGKHNDYEVRFTFGVEPLQQYLVEFSGGKLQCIPVAWDTIKKKWFHVFPELKIHHGEWLHWSRGGANWNSMCADCHSTDFKKNYDKEEKKYHSTYSEINVGCRSCHGNMDEHLQWAKSSDKKNKQKILNLKKLSHKPEDIMNKNLKSSHLVESCARCHSRRSQITNQYELGEPFLDHYLPELLRANTYHADGQILDEVYVHGSFLQSKMYHRGVSCVHCHDPHSNQIKHKGNALCTQCHTPSQYDTPKHHFHKNNTKGASCIECHMPGKHYMVNDFRRDHSFRIPRPDQSIKYGTPNACNQCHQDQKPQWAKVAIDKWYGSKRKPHYSDTTLKVFNNQLTDMEELLTFVQDNEQPGFVRASMLPYLQPYGKSSSKVMKFYETCIDNEDDYMRLGTTMAMENWPPLLRKPLAEHLIKDKRRAIRIQAFSLLVDIHETKISNDIKEDYEKAKKEYLNSLNINADFPSGMMNYGNHYLKKAESVSLTPEFKNNSKAITAMNKLRSIYEEKAVDAYRETLEIDNRFSAARMNLSRLYNMQGKNDEAKKMLKTVVDQEPEFWGAWFNYGLLLSETKEYQKANYALGKAAQLSNGNPDVYYNWALSTQSMGKAQQAEGIYLDGLKHVANDIRLLNGLVILYCQNKRFNSAKIYSKKLLMVDRNNESFYRRHQWILQKIQQQK